MQLEIWFRWSPADPAGVVSVALLARYSSLCEAVQHYDSSLISQPLTATRIAAPPTPSGPALAK